MDPNLLVGLGAPDDAAVYRLNDQQALVLTVDFFTPVVDDPWTFGAIAAANSLSDIYAMGATPLLALNIFAFPKDLSPTLASEILRGGQDKAREAGIPIVGGHSVQDAEPKFGLVVAGLVHPGSLQRKGGARPGDGLYLSKALGTGVITTAAMKDKAPPEALFPAVTSMLQLNEKAAALAQRFGATAMTDITGFGLMGHGLELADQSEVGLEISLKAIPWLTGSRSLGQAGLFPGGAHANEKYYGDRVHGDSLGPAWERTLTFSPETSGGLFISLPPEGEAALRESEGERQESLWRIGEVVEGEGIYLLS